MGEPAPFQTLDRTRPRVVVGFAGAALLLLSGCARTSVRSQVDPTAVAKRFQKVMVFGAFSDLEFRQDAEQEFVKTLASRGFQAVPSAVFLFPGRQYSAEEVKQAIAAAEVDAVLILSPGESGATSSWVPGTSTTTITRGPTVYYPDGTTSGGQATGATTTSTGGYAVEKPWERFQAQLFDHATGQPVWVASFSSKGNALANRGHLVRSMARKAASALATQHLLR